MPCDRPPTCRWTLCLSGLILLLNLGLFFPHWENATKLLTWLQYDGVAVREGQGYRIFTANLVHWSREHFLLDFAAFLALGLLYERFFPRSYPWLLLWIAIVVSFTGLFVLAEQALCRGLSGVTAGQFTAALWIEWSQARRAPVRWLWVAPATAIVVFWIGYGLVTGKTLFVSGGAEVAAWAHVAGALAATLFLLLRSILRNRSGPARPGPVGRRPLGAD